MTDDLRLDALWTRVTDLERRQTHLRRVALAAVLCCTTLVLMAQTALPGTVTARELVLVGQDGEVRARLQAYPRLPYGGVVMKDARGNDMLLLMRLDDGRTSFSVHEDNGPSGFRVLAGPTSASAKVYTKGSTVETSVSDTASSISVAGFNTSLLELGIAFKNLNKPLMSEAPVVSKTTEDRPKALLSVGPTESALTLEDHAGYQAVAGNVALEEPKGGTTTTSAASLILFGSNKKVRWQAPR